MVSPHPPTPLLLQWTLHHWIKSFPMHSSRSQNLLVPQGNYTLPWESTSFLEQCFRKTAIRMSGKDQIRTSTSTAACPLIPRASRLLPSCQSDPQISLVDKCTHRATSQAPRADPWRHHRHLQGMWHSKGNSGSNHHLNHNHDHRRLRNLTTSLWQCWGRQPPPYNLKARHQTQPEGLRHSSAIDLHH